MYRRSLVGRLSFGDMSEDKSQIEEAARKDSAVHVSLSSYSPVKQPGTKEVPPSGEPESRRSSTASDWDRKPVHRVSVRSFEDAPSHRGGGVPKAGI